MILKASINSRYSIKVIDVDLEKGLAGHRLENSTISEDEYKRRMQELDSLLPFSESPPPDIVGNESLLPYYEEEGNSIIQKWEIVNNDINIINQKIKELKAQLADTDYKVMKCYEATLLDLPLPYLMDDVHRIREDYRDRLNELEALLDE